MIRSAACHHGRSWRVHPTLLSEINKSKPLTLLVFPRPPMCRLKQKAPIRMHIEPAQVITPTGKYQRVVFALIINTELQLDICRGCRDWFPFKHLIDQTKL